MQVYIFGKLSEERNLDRILFRFLNITTKFEWGNINIDEIKAETMP